MKIRVQAIVGFFFKFLLWIKAVITAVEENYCEIWRRTQFTCDKCSGTIKTHVKSIMYFFFFGVCKQIFSTRNLVLIVPNFRSGFCLKILWSGRRIRDFIIYLLIFILDPERSFVLWKIIKMFVHRIFILVHSRLNKILKVLWHFCFIFSHLNLLCVYTIFSIRV